MGNPLIGGSGGEGSGGGGPDIPIPDFFTQATQTTAGQKAAGWFANLVAQLAASIMPALTTYMTAALSVLDSVMALATNLLTASQGMNSPGFFQLTAAMIEDLLGVPITSATMEAAFRRGGNVAGMTDVGGKFLDVLTHEFVSGASLSPDQGISAAKAFLGFVLAFSVREANVSVTTSLIPEEFRILDGVRDYGVDMARNLGLGRLTRLAFAPLMKALVQTPMTWYFNNKYRPTLLSYSESVRANLRGGLTADQLKTSLAYQGYPDDFMQALTLEAIEQPSYTDYYEMYKWGMLAEQDAVKGIQLRGTLPDRAQTFFDAERFRDADTEINSTLSRLASMFEAGFMDSATWNDQLDALPIAPDRKSRYKDYVTLYKEYPHKTLSLAEVQSGVESGYLDVDDMATWLSNAGYGPGDAATLILLTFEKLQTAEAKLAIAKFKYALAVAKAKAKGNPIPPPPPGVGGIV
ncbi:MAG: hypothetical protein ACRD4Q_01740 [Candidatus Acidiferrales bacterium]